MIVDVSKLCVRVRKLGIRMCLPWQLKMASGETSSFCVKKRETEGEKEVAVNY